MKTYTFDDIQVGQLWGLTKERIAEIRIPQTWFIITDKGKDEDGGSIIQIQWLHEKDRKHSFRFNDLFFQIYDRVTGWVE